MSAKQPVLILQMQRMGDLVLTYPLLLWLARRFRGHPLMVAAEPLFFRELLPLSPEAEYVAWNEADKLVSSSFRLVVNLSHRPEAAQLAGRLTSEQTLGPAVTDKGKYIRGNWLLYRASLVHNNRHNRFHWADLNSLDTVPIARMAATEWPEPRTPEPGNNRVGLFLGASQEEKRPNVDFWVELVGCLLHRGLRPLLLGGLGEKGLGAQVAKRAGKPVLNLCGKFSVAELARALSPLALFVTPDTGPMHLAAWGGTRTLNLSMGPVSPWETGPYQPGHWVLRADMSCVGCWRCTHVTPQACHGHFKAPRVAGLIQRMVAAKTDGLERMDLPGLRLMATSRDQDGLYHLKPLGPPRPPSARDMTAQFWRDYFGAHFKRWDMERATDSFAQLSSAYPRLEGSLRKGLLKLARFLAQAARTPGTGLAEDHWAQNPPLLRPLAGYLQLFLNNADFSRRGFQRALTLTESLLGLMD